MVKVYSRLHAFPFVLLAFISLASPLRTSSRSDKPDLQNAIEEMEKANYFTFVMLINMAPNLTSSLSNLTFLMPNDRTLSKLLMLPDDVSDFLLRHSIPSPLLFEHLEHIPTGSKIPSFLPNYMLRISNGGRRNFLLNNVRIISPNICTSGYAIRCHGIDGVLPEMSALGNDTSCPSSLTSSTPPSSSMALPPSPMFAAAAPTAGSSLSISLSSSVSLVCLLMMSPSSFLL